MRLITERIYYISYKLKGCTYECNEVYLADSIEEAISLCKESNKECFITEVRAGAVAKRKSTKQITVDV